MMLKNNRLLILLILTVLSADLIQAQDITTAQFHGKELMPDKVCADTLKTDFLWKPVYPFKGPTSILEPVSKYRMVRKVFMDEFFSSMKTFLTIRYLDTGSRIEVGPLKG